MFKQTNKESRKSTLPKLSCYDIIMVNESNTYVDVEKSVDTARKCNLCHVPRTIPSLKCYKLQSHLRTSACPKVQYQMLFILTIVFYILSIFPFVIHIISKTKENNQQKS